MMFLSGQELLFTSYKVRKNECRTGIFTEELSKTSGSGIFPESLF
jgi:hypothetical protein